jgi:hypothetical protein
VDPKAALEPTFGRSRKRCTRPPSWSDWPSLLPRAAEGAVTGRIALGNKAHSPNRGSHRQPRYAFGLDQRPCDIKGRGIAECLDAINLSGCTAHKDTLRRPCLPTWTRSGTDGVAWAVVLVTSVGTAAAGFGASVGSAGAWVAGCIEGLVIPQPFAMMIRSDKAARTEEFHRIPPLLVNGTWQVEWSQSPRKIPPSRSPPLLRGAMFQFRYVAYVTFVAGVRTCNPC